MRTRMNCVLDSPFFSRPVLTVAEELLGKYLVCGDEARMVTEVEAYDGPEDRACHGCHGLTQRTKPLFGPAGHWYVYLCYGMYWMLNIVTNEPGYPAAVLIRGVEGLSGPGKLTKALKIDKRFNGLPAMEGTGLWVEDRGAKVSPSCIERTPRVGVAYAGAWAKKPYRFVVCKP